MIGGFFAGAAHGLLDHALGDAILAYADALKPDADGWYPMESYHEGSRVLFFLEEGEKGNGEIASGMAFKDDGGSYSSFWTWGGPNSGSVVDGTAGAGICSLHNIHGLGVILLRDDGRRDGRDDDR